MSCLLRRYSAASLSLYRDAVMLGKQRYLKNLWCCGWFLVKFDALHRMNKNDEINQV